MAQKKLFWFNIVFKTLKQKLFFLLSLTSNGGIALVRLLLARSKFPCLKNGWNIL